MCWELRIELLSYVQTKAGISSQSDKLRLCLLHTRASIQPLIPPHLLLHA